MEILYNLEGKGKRPISQILMETSPYLESQDPMVRCATMVIESRRFKRVCILID